MFTISDRSKGEVLQIVDFLKKLIIVQETYVNQLYESFIMGLFMQEKVLTRESKNVYKHLLFSVFLIGIDPEIPEMLMKENE